MRITVKRENRNSLEIQVFNGKIVVFAPYYAPSEQIKYLVESKSDWIKNRLRCQSTTSNRQTEITEHIKNSRNEENGSYDDKNLQYSFKELLLFGKRLTIVDSTKKKVLIDNDCLSIYGASSYDRRRSECKKLIRTLSAEKIPLLASMLFSKLGVCPCGIEIKALKQPNALRNGDSCEITKWGKLENSVAYFDPQIIQLPVFLQRFVVGSIGAYILTNSFSGREYAKIMKSFTEAGQAKELSGYSYLKELF